MTPTAMAFVFALLTAVAVFAASTIHSSIESRAIKAHAMNTMVDNQIKALRDTYKTPDHTRTGEPFTATTDCPKCGHMAVHWLEQPRHRPEGDDPVAEMQRRITLTMSMLNPERAYDPPSTVAARRCVKCDYRWGQS